MRFFEEIQYVSFIVPECNIVNLALDVVYALPSIYICTMRQELYIYIGELSEYCVSVDIQDLKYCQCLTMSTCGVIGTHHPLEGDLYKSRYNGCSAHIISFAAYSSISCVPDHISPDQVNLRLAIQCRSGVCLTTKSHDEPTIHLGNDCLREKKMLFVLLKDI